MTTWKNGVWTMDNRDVISLASQPAVTCPKHGKHSKGVVAVYIPEMEGRYCMICYVEMIRMMCHKVTDA